MNFSIYNNFMTEIESETCAGLSADAKCIKLQKRSLRVKVNEMLNEICADSSLHEKASQSAAEAFINSRIYRDAAEIFAFMPLPQEIDVRIILRQALADGKKTAVPKIVPETNDMDFYYLTSETNITAQVAAGAFGIMEPDEQAEKVNCSAFPENAVILVPGLAFSPKGARLGRGKGFYDKYLSGVFSADPQRSAGNRPAVCGICFSRQIMEDIPAEPHDFLMDYLLSEKGFISLNRQNKA